MRIKINTSFLLIIFLILVASCQEEKPVKKKKQFTTQKQADAEPENVLTPVDSATEKGIYNISSAQFKELNMEIGKAEIESVNQSIIAAGYIEAPREGIAEVRTYIGGYLRSTPLLPGDYVKKGQYLVSLENMEYIQLQQDYLQSRDELEYLKTVYQRKKTLADEKITSLDSKQDAERDYNSALAKFEGLKKMLKLININPDKLSPENISSTINLYAPINGYLTKVNAVEGLFADQTDVIFEIINTNHLHLELKVFEKDILNVKKGQQITFRLPEANSDSYSGEVFLVGKTIDQTDKTVMVHCHITQKYDLPLIVGMYVEAEIHFNTKQEFCLPAEAFVREEGNYFVYVANSITEDEYLFEKTMVDVGRVSEDCVEIVGESREFLEGKNVLIKGAFDL